MRARFSMSACAFVVMLGLIALWLPKSSFAQDISGFVSDDFSATQLDTITWSVIDPRGDSTVSVAENRLRITVPAGTNHDMPNNGDNTAARVMQPLFNTDVELEVKFESPVQAGQIQGIVIEQEAGTYLVFNVYHNGTQTRIQSIEYLNNVSSNKQEKVIADDAPIYLRVKRQDNTWTYYFSYDGIIWNAARVLTSTLIPNSAGVLAGNFGGANAPEHTAIVDYMFSTATPVEPEDGEVIADNSGPYIRDIKKLAGANQFQVLWETDEAATSTIEYGQTSSYGASVDSTTLTGSHDLAVTGLTPDTIYHFRLRSTDAAGNETVSEDFTITVSANPYLDLWYGSNPTFGLLGSNAQRWTNIPGHVSGANTITSLEYSLNGALAQPLSLGADGLRLQDNNDFNADIEYLDLFSGPNSLAITATDNAGNQTTENLSLNYVTGNTWPLPYTINWSTVAKIENAAQVVDGAWELTGNGLRTRQTGYDRAIAIGDISWENYEVTVPVTLHGVDQNCFIDLASNPCNGGPLVGVLMRWQGHHVTFIQPNWEWRPLGALGAYRWFKLNNRAETEPGLFMLDGGGLITNRDLQQAFPVGTTHIFKLRAETVASGQSLYKTKMWPQDQAEPIQWDIEQTQEIGTSNTNGSLLLLAHYTDATFGNVTVTSLDGFGGDTIAPVISNVQTTVTDTTATITWDTDEAATSAVNYGLSAGYGSNQNDPGLVTSHSITLTNLLPGTLYHFQVGSTDASNNTASGIDRVLTTNADTTSPSGILSDGFDDAVLNTGLWNWVDPVGNSSYAMTGSQLAISVPAGSSHDLWTNTNQVPRVLQPANNTDFELEAKFDSALTSRYQIQGILVEGSANRLVRFDFYSDGNSTRIHAATLTNGTASMQIRTTIVDGVPLYMRVVRQGDQWTEFYSYDGANWIQAGSFVYTLEVTAAGVFGGNAGPNPAHTTLVDYFTIDGLAPGTGGGDITPPVISNVQTVVTDTTATITWDTDEAATSAVTYGLSAGYGSNQSSASLVTSHSITLTNLAPGTTYHFLVSSTDANSNSADDTDRTFATNAGSSSPSGIVSDAFNNPSLNTSLWNWVDPVGNSSYAMTGSQLAISVPAGSSHDLWTNTNQVPRVLQPANNTDFELEAKFDSALTSRYQIQGILVEGSANRLLRFDFYSDGNTTRIHAATLTNGTARMQIRTTIVDGVPLYMRVVRQGNQWTEFYSYDGANWIQAGSFVYTLEVTAAGVFGGNAGPNPAHTTLVDYFTIDGLAPGSGTAGEATLTAVPISTSRIDLYWDALDGATGYKIYRDSRLVSTTSGIQYSDSGVDTGQTHIYEVLALIGGAEQPIARPLSVKNVDNTKGAWWNIDWPYRTLVGVGSGQFKRTNAIAELDINITQVLEDIGNSGAFNPATVRCHEVDINGSIVGSEIPCQFDPSEDFDATTRATGKLVIFAPGIIASRSARYFHLYFDIAGGKSTPTSLIPLVTIKDDVVDEGQLSYQISNSTGSFFFQKEAGAFSSLVDNQGNDWIDYHPTGKAAGNYRGIPNLVYPESHFHPGSVTATSTIINRGPVKITVRSETTDGLWQLTWEFYPETATMTVLNAAKPYWFLYEGTPGGILDTSKDFMVRSDGVTTPLSQSWNGDLAGDEWVFFSDPGVKRSLFLAQHDQNDSVDSYRPLEDQMTVFGFGRKQTGLNSYLNQIPARFTIGLIEQTDYNGAAELINSSIKSLNVESSGAAIFSH